MVLLLMLFVMLAGVSNQYEERLLKHHRADLQQIVTEQGVDLSSRLNEHISLVNSLWSFCQIEKDNPAFRRQFKVFAEGLGWDRSGLRALQIFPPEGTVLIYPEAGNEDLLDGTLSELLADERPSIRESVAEALKCRECIVNDPYELLQGGLGLVARRAVYSEGTLWGMASVIVDLPVNFDSDSVESGFQANLVRMTDQNGTLLFGASDSLKDPVTYELSFYKQTWRIEVAPESGWRSIYRFELTLFIASGSLVILIFSILIYFLSRQRIILREKVAFQTKELRERASLLNASQAVSKIGSWRLDLVADRFSFSEETCRIFNISPDAPLAGLEEILQNIHPEDREKVESGFLRSIENDESSFEVDFRLIDDGSRGGRFVSVRCDHFKNEDGRVTESIGILQDITEQIENIREKERLAVVVEQVTEMIVILGTDRIIKYVNPAFERITGYTREEAVGHYADLLKSGKHEDSYTEQVWEELEAGRSWSGRFINRKKDGTLYTDETSISPLSDEDGRIISFVEIKKDITRELDMQEQLDRTRREESVGRLAGGIAHDLNNNLSPVLGFTELLLDKGELSSSDRSMLEHIHSAGIRSRDLVQKLMAFGRKQTLAFTPMELNSLLMTFKPYLRRMIRADIAVVYRLEAGLPRISADVGQIEQVLFNLTANAQDAVVGKGLIRIETCLKNLPNEFIPEGKPKDESEYIEWSISDTGRGIGKEIQGLIFDPFFTTKGGGASGLGLSTVYGIVKQHGGFVAVDSSPDRGSRFSIYLPCSSDSDLPGEESGGLPNPKHGSEKILLVDDDRNTRELTRTILKENGYEVSIISEPEEFSALADSRSDVFSLLLVNTITYGLLGSVLYRNLKKTIPDLKVLYMSVTADEAPPCGEEGETVPFIRKPFTVRELTGRVKEILDS